MTDVTVGVGIVETASARLPICIPPRASFDSDRSDPKRDLEDRLLVARSTPTIYSRQMRFQFSGLDEISE